MIRRFFKSDRKDKPLVEYVAAYAMLIALIVLVVIAVRAITTRRVDRWISEPDRQLNSG